MRYGPEISDALGRRWHLLRGEPLRSKRPVLVVLVRVLRDANAA